MRITRKTCRSTYSPYHKLRVWIYFLSGQAKSLGRGRCWLWLKSTHTMNLDPILKCLHVIRPPLASYSASTLLVLPPEDRSASDWHIWEEWIGSVGVSSSPSSWEGDWPQSTRIPLSSTPPKLGRRGGLPWPNTAITLTLNKSVETSVVQMKLLASIHWHLLTMCLKSKWGRMVLLSTTLILRMPEAYQNL